MEYDKTTAPKGLSEAHAYPHDSIPTGNRYGKLRVKGDDFDAAILAAPLTLPFSGRVVKNRFLKAPMTE